MDFFDCPKVLIEKIRAVRVSMYLILILIFLIYKLQKKIKSCYRIIFKYYKDAEILSNPPLIFTMFFIDLELRIEEAIILLYPPLQ